MMRCQLKRDTNKSSTVLRAFRVLESVADEEDPISAAEVARRLDIDRITAYRMLRTLEEAGYLEIHPHSKRFSMTHRVLTLARPLLDLGEQTERVDALLRAVAKRTGETCHYSELSGTETVLTRRMKGQQLVAVDFNIGTRCELHATSVGKAILAFQTEEFIGDYTRLELRTYTDRTISHPSDLRKELERIRERTVSYDFEELSVGMNCVAIPVRSVDGKVEAGISISGPTLRLTAIRLEQLARIMQEEMAASQL